MWGSKRLERIEGALRELAKLKEVQGDAERLNALETRLERLELDSSRQQIEVLTALDKALHQLRARAGVRARRAKADDDESEQNDKHDPHQHRLFPPLSTRLRSF